MKFRAVIATRLSKEEFLTASATGKSLSKMRQKNFEVRLFHNNKSGLSKVYNQALQETITSPAVLVFMHDDLHLLDFFWTQRVKEGLEQFDILGLAGNTRRIPHQPAWLFKSDRFDWDDFSNFSGAVAHGNSFPPKDWSVFGPTPRQVVLFDGLFIAVKSETLLKHELFFDERFDFHFYDMDFCRQAEQKGLRCGTWPIAVMHESGGNFGSPNWRKGLEMYRKKWPD